MDGPAASGRALENLYFLSLANRALDLRKGVLVVFEQGPGRSDTLVSIRKASPAPGYPTLPRLLPWRIIRGRSQNKNEAR